MTRVSAAIFAALRDRVHARCFARTSSAVCSRIGAEVEFLVIDGASHAPVPLRGPDGGLLALVRDHARFAGWREARSARGTPRFEVPGRADVTFEPGGQLEISTIACESASRLLTLLEQVVAPLRRALARRGVVLVGRGIDPLTPIENVALQHHVERYERMTRYFERIGPYGARMMRQTAAVQVSLDSGPRPGERWRLLNDIAPFLVATFANSPHYEGRETGHESYRAHCWRLLDPTRTGVLADRDPATAYTSFALGARDIMRETPDGAYQSFGNWIAAGEWTEEQWERHLTTLFPEVRPRGHFEVRSCDAVEPSLYAALIVFLCGLVYDEGAATEAATLTAGSGDLLAPAGEAGLRDEYIARTSRDLFALALEGADRLPPSYLAREHIERARDTYQTLTCRGLSPGRYAVPARSAAERNLSRTA